MVSYRVGNRAPAVDAANSPPPCWRHILAEIRPGDARWCSHRVHHPSGARCLARFLVFVVRGDRRALGAALATVLVGYAAAVWALGASTIFDYLTRVLPLVTRLYRASDGNISAWTVGWRVFGGTRSEVLAGISAPPLVQSALAAGLVSTALPVLILLASLIAIRKQPSEGTAIGLMICVSVLVTRSPGTITLFSPPSQPPRLSAG